MNIHLYEVETSGITLNQTIEGIFARKMQLRKVVVGGYNMRMEHREMRKLQNGESICLMEFCKIRVAGPGRAHPNIATTGFNLAPNEGFGELTAALYSPKMNCVLVQYNHYGPRAGTIAEYFSTLADSGHYAFHPRLRDDVIAQMERSGYATSIEVKLATHKLVAENMNPRGPVGGFLAATDKVTSVGHALLGLYKERSKPMTEFLNFVRSFLSLSEEQEGVVERLSLVARETEESPDEFLDLLKAKVIGEYNDLSIDPKTRLYPRSQRWDGLVSVYETWRKERIIYRSPQPVKP